MNKILILHNKPENNRKDDADTLIQVAEISNALKSLNCRVNIGSVSDSLIDVEKLIKQHQPQLVFNLVESFCGSDKNQYLIPACLESMGVAYTGCPSTALFLASDKVTAKKIMCGAGIPTPAYLEDNFLSGDINESTKMIVKSKTEHASFGIDSDSIVVGTIAAQNLIQRKTQTLGGAWMAEQYIEGREFNVSVIGSNISPKILPLAEIVFTDFAEGVPKIVDYSAKWDADSHGYKNTPRNFIDEKAEYILAKKIKDITLKCWKIFEIHGYARVDFRIDSDGNPWVLEINTNPCLTSDAGFIAASEKSGMDYIETINHIMDITNYDSLPEKTKASLVG